MAYQQKVVDSITKAPKSLGNQLGRWAVYHDLPVTIIARATGVSRQTVYNWFTNTDVFVAYRERVECMLQILQTSKSKEEARRRVCTEFNLDP